MSGYFQELYEGGKSLLVGMGITFKYMLQPVVTMQYPRQSVKMTPRYRGHIELVADEKGNNKCIVCGMCQRNCPSGCISLAGKKPEGGKKKVLTQYQLDFTTCSLCGSCVEGCPTGALDFSKEYNLAGLTRQEYIFDLLKRFEERKR
ncbi:MAG TPA: NADH-quinone oxidoreductase subunit I [Desulfurivibrio alkaliphilus]|uniref:NADH-quinone oxidoreductase subunit I n=1 Tax=Desulfurivibrio alkaliphilus TaxID=427923 RepID=A0A7C2TFC3_9BACT|nr:NADH-quinone oxidoreductase subunit I [Desulfurivibrio alkaliphilus]